MGLLASRLILTHAAELARSHVVSGEREVPACEQAAEYFGLDVTDVISVYRSAFGKGN